MGVMLPQKAVRSLRMRAAAKNMPQGGQDEISLYDRGKGS